MNKFIPYAHHDIDENDIKSVVDVLKSDWLTTGPKVQEFENVFSKFVGSKFSVAVSSATAGLDISVNSLSLPEGSEIITTPLTFAASANCILYNRCKPIFADIDKNTMNIDPKKIKEKITKKTKAIIPVHYAGQPCDMDRITDIAKDNNLHIIEDAAHAIAAQYKERKIGSISEMTVFSLHAAKNITTGEGGVITTNDENLYKKLILFRSHGIDRSPLQRHGSSGSYVYDMKLLGKNYRITDFQCALGITQLAKAEKIRSIREKISSKYSKELSKIKEITLPLSIPNIVHARHLYPILLDKNIDRDKFFEIMRSKNIGVNVHYIPVYELSYYKNLYNLGKKDFPITSDISSREISLPLHTLMSDKDVDYVIQCVKETIKEMTI